MAYGSGPRDAARFNAAYRPVLCSLLMCLAMAAGCSKPAGKPSPGADLGRYVIVHSPQVERDAILLDTETGRTWSRVEVTDLTDEPVAWAPMPQLNTDADMATLRAAHPAKAPPARPDDMGGFTPLTRDRPPESPR